MKDWPAALTDMEARVRTVERYLAGEEVHVAHFVLPGADLGPLPAELKSRAETVLAATRAAEEKLAVAMEEASTRLRSRPAPALGAEERPAPSYVSRLA